MRDSPLPVDAATGDARHRDVRAEVFAVVPQQRATLRTRIIDEFRSFLRGWGYDEV